MFDVSSLEQWQRCQPVSVLTLDLADRAVLRVAGMYIRGPTNILIFENI